MCRLAGFWDFTYRGEYDIEGTVSKMRDTLAYGGPDDFGHYIDGKAGVALGHRRLSILDLSARAKQPMVWKEFVIVYNGEVYNFQQIKEELQEKGYEFETDSDTEVVLKAFAEWEFECVHKFRGMWAFAIWDQRNQRLVLCRDRVGVKPLYWYMKDGVFMFASELKAFHKHPKFKKEMKKEALLYFFKYGYIPSPLSIFHNTYKLEPATFLVIDAKKNIKTFKYWDIEKISESFTINLSEQEIIEELERILKESFKLRLVSDVPVGVFLSGGIDSSLVTALLQSETSTPLKTFTIGFYEKDYDEAPYAKEIAKWLGTEHYEFYITPKEAYEVIHNLPFIHDEPFGDSSSVPTYLVAKYSREIVKVALSADGGDEQFCGYTNYWPSLKLAEMGARVPKILRFAFAKIGWTKPAYVIARNINHLFLGYSNFRDKYFKLLNALNYSDEVKIFDISKSYYMDHELQSLFNFEIKPPLLYDKNGCYSSDKLQNLMLQDIKTYLVDDILVKVDRVTMQVALESREPLLDVKILEFTSKLPSQYKCRNGLTKYIVRKILYKYIPQELIDRPKKGFGMPVYEWFRKELKELYEHYLSERELKATGIFNERYIRNLLNAYYRGEPTNPSRFWLILMFQMWHEKWM